MPETNNYVVELSESEIHSLLECLAELRKKYVYDAQRGGQKPLDNPVFVAACELQHKIARILIPNSNVSLEEYLNYGKDDAT